MILLDGRKLAQRRREQLATAVQLRTGQGYRPPGLAVILVGEDPASQVYVRNKVAACEAAGMHSTVIRLPHACTQAELHTEIHRLNQAPEFDGVLIQLPLPVHLDAAAAFAVLDPRKDPDCLTATNVGLFHSQQTRVAPCTPSGILMLLKEYGAPLRGARALVIGRSHIVGRPMAELLISQDATVTVAHSKTENLRKLVREYQVVVVAAGRPHLLRGSDFAQGAWVVDVGIHRVPSADGKSGLRGDVDPDGAEKHLAALSPVPGGVGPMTIAALLENTLRLAELRTH